LRACESPAMKRGIRHCNYSVFWLREQDLNL
jgi:hypothetical protein